MRTSWIFACVAGAVVLAASAALWLAPRPAPVQGGGDFVAFSLAEAESRSKRGRVDPEVQSLGGITRLIGVVHDTERSDLIVVGRIVPGEPPVSMDDFAVALRALLVHRAWPLVSIDKTPDTRSTGRQRVRFEGGIDGSGMGDALLRADVTLKLLALGLLPEEIPGLESYFAMSLRAAREASGHLANVTTRFWFHPLGVSFVARDGVFVANDFTVGVHAQVVTAATSSAAPGGDEPGQRFADSLSKQYASRRQPSTRSSCVETTSPAATGSRRSAWTAASRSARSSCVSRTAMSRRCARLSSSPDPGARYYGGGSLSTAGRSPR